jgi:hypothetical protein
VKTLKESASERQMSLAYDGQAQALRYPSDMTDGERELSAAAGAADLACADCPVNHLLLGAGTGVRLRESLSS